MCYCASEWNREFSIICLSASSSSEFLSCNAPRTLVLNMKCKLQVLIFMMMTREFKMNNEDDDEVFVCSSFRAKLYNGRFLIKNFFWFENEHFLSWVVYKMFLSLSRLHYMVNYNFHIKRNKNIWTHPKSTFIPSLNEYFIHTIWMKFIKKLCYFLVCTQILLRLPSFNIFFSFLKWFRSEFTVFVFFLYFMKKKFRLKFSTDKFYQNQNKIVSALNILRVKRATSSKKGSFSHCKNFISNFSRAKRAHALQSVRSE